MTSRTSFIMLLILHPMFASAQITPFTIPVNVNEVNLTFTAADVNGLPINDLQLPELRLRDNGKPPERILSFQRRNDLQIRAGILMDISRSMSGYLPREQSIVTTLNTHILRQNSDQAFITRFDFDAILTQGWTSSSDTLLASLHHVPDHLTSRLGGTAIFDTLYITCRDQFTHSPPSTTGKSNFILLFTDGDDNASHARLQDVIDIAQFTHTAIYVFSAARKQTSHPGQLVLQELAKQSGGRIFYDHGAKEDLANLRIVEQDLRDNYILVYKPAHLDHDGSFHRIKLTSPPRNAVINTRTGYYAPKETPSTP